MAKKHGITRRDFVNGIAIGTAAGSILSPMDIAKAAGLSPETHMGEHYPPALTGLRGSHVGSFEVAHGVAWQGKKWDRPSAQTDDTYDLVVLGGGISGLSAAFLYQQHVGTDAKILILDNHDDFGGHAKRNEFDVDGQTLIGYGGSQSMEAPGKYSAASKKLLRDINIDVQAFYQAYDQEFYGRYKLENAIYFNKENYGVDRILPDPFGNWFDDPSSAPLADTINAFPVDDATKAALLHMLSNEIDYLPGLSNSEKIELMRKISYVDFLHQYAGIPKDGTDILTDKFKGYWGIGWDALSALEGFRMSMPGTYGLGLSPSEVGEKGSDEPYIFHFPDGNAGVARCLVRKLIPSAVPGHTMQDVVKSRVIYEELDRAGANVRLRLNSTGVDVRHTDNGQEVDLTYVQNGRAHRVRSKHTILACYNNIIPHICPEVPKAQRDAIGTATKIPLVYTNIAIRNWRAFVDLGFQSIFIPKAKLMYQMSLDFPVSMGGYDFSSDPDQPIIVHGTVIPTVPNQGFNEREQHIMGRQQVYATSFEEYEDDIIRQMDGALGGAGFDVERDIAAITVNRWPHGYAYEYNELWDPADWSPTNGPHIAGRARIGRISIANSDASAYAYVNGAIDAAVRAVDEQVAL